MAKIEEITSARCSVPWYCVYMHASGIMYGVSRIDCCSCTRNERFMACVVL